MSGNTTGGMMKGYITSGNMTSGMMRGNTTSELPTLEGHPVPYGATPSSSTLAHYLG